MTAPPNTTDPETIHPLVGEDEEPVTILDPSDYPTVDHLVTEDDTPVDNVFAAKQHRLLVEPLYASQVLAGRTFIADANVGVFASIYRPAIVPDAFLSLDVQLPPNFREKRYRSYFLWEYGKPPDAVIELISDLRGEELGAKMHDYAQIGTRYYIIFDPDRHFKGALLRVYGLRVGIYEELESHWLPDIGLGLTLWEGTYEGAHDTWLRWCDQDRHVIPTGAERAEQEHQRAERLLAQLRALGVEPETDPQGS